VELPPGLGKEGEVTGMVYGRGGGNFGIGWGGVGVEVVSSWRCGRAFGSCVGIVRRC
jgi:hypothetical protein